MDRKAQKALQQGNPGLFDEIWTAVTRATTDLWEGGKTILRDLGLKPKDLLPLLEMVPLLL